MVKLFPPRPRTVKLVSPAKSPDFSEAMFWEVMSRLVRLARSASVTAAQSSTSASAARIASCTCCVRSQMPVVVPPTA